jgi:hypothetical protein
MNRHSDFFNGISSRLIKDAAARVSAVWRKRWMGRWIQQSMQIPDLSMAANGFLDRCWNC